MLKRWKQKNSFYATYRKLLKLCCDAEDFATAQAICDVLTEKAGGKGESQNPIPKWEKKASPYSQSMGVPMDRVSYELKSANQHLCQASASQG